MDLVVRGFRSKEIEGELEITNDQVNHSLRCVYVKLGAKTLAHAAALYTRQTTTPS